MNKQNPNFKFLLLNKSDSDIKNGIDQLNNILVEHQPHLLVINETQKHKYDIATKHQFPGYIMELDSLDLTDGWSRTPILISQSVKYKRRTDLEQKGLCHSMAIRGVTWDKAFLDTRALQAVTVPRQKGLQEPASTGAKVDTNYQKLAIGYGRRHRNPDTWRY